MTSTEKRLLAILLLLALAALSLKVNDLFLARTKKTPDFGGEYSEGIVGELKYLNPVLAQSESDQAASRLLFSGLVKIDERGVWPDLAESWEILDSGQKYTFTLKKDVFFHDGAQFGAKDVLFTLENIKNVAEDGAKSPLYDRWKDVTVSAEGDFKINFELPRPYGPFIYNLDFGIIPAHLGQDELARRFIGTGPYKYEDLVKAKTVSELILARNENYHNDKAYFARARLKFFTSDSDAKKAFANREVLALFGAKSERNDAVNLFFASAKRLGLLFNLKNVRFQDKEFRRKLLSAENFSQKEKVRLIALNSPLQRDKAVVLAEKFLKQNIEVETIFLTPLQLKDVLDSAEYELLLYGFDFGYDRDPYVFWHSSQIGKLNFSGFSDKSSDIILEDARMILDAKERNAKYDQFYEMLKNEYLAVFFEPVKYDFNLDRRVMGLSPIFGLMPASRFDNIASWYIKEKRVKN